MDAALLRVSLHAGQSEAQPWPDLTGTTDEHVRQWLGWLEKILADTTIAEAIAAASPVLLSEARSLCGGDQRQARRVRRVRRVVLSVLRYVLRAEGRATPFGLFAGVAPVRFSPHTAVRIGHRHQAALRADAGWLDGVVRGLEAIPELLDQLPVIANDLCVVQDGRLTVPWQPNTTPAGGNPIVASIRLTKPIQAALQAAASPVPLGRIARSLGETLPAASAKSIATLLSGLVECRVLLTALRPPMTVLDPLAHVLEIASQAGADELPSASALMHELRVIRDDLRCGLQTPADLSSRMTAVSSVSGPPFMTDLKVDATLSLSPQVAHEAAAAAAALTRLTPNPVGHPAWLDYHGRYLDRYGVGAVVPVLEITNPDIGLGFPARFRDSALKVHARRLTARDARLLALAQTAAVEGELEVALSNTAVDELSDGVELAAVQPHGELIFHLQALSAKDIDRGEFTLAVTGAPRTAGTTTGRFLHLLAPSDRDRMTAAYAGLPTLHGGAIDVQVSGPPLFTRVGNVARAPAVLPRTLHIAEHPLPDGDMVKLNDLAVCGDNTRLWLISLTDGRHVEPRVMNAVEFRNNTQPVIRFLCEITNAFTPTFTAFDWGAAGRLPFLPGIRYRRTLLSPARWRLPATALPGPTATFEEWEKAVRDWLGKFRVPNLLHLTERDLRIRLDLAEPSHLALLRDHLNQHENAVLSQAPSPQDHGWIDGRAHEIALPFAAEHPAPAATRPRPSAPPPRCSPPRLPGVSPWLYAKLYGNPDRQDTVLTQALPDLLTALGDAAACQFLRFEDPDHHLRIRLRLPGPDAFGPAARALGTWATQLHERGLATRLQLDTYQPETNRYGTGAALDAAEEVFATDSQAAIVEIRHATERRLHRHAVTAVSMTRIAATFLGDTDTAMRWLTDTIPARSTSPVPREVHRQAVSLSNTPDSQGTSDSWMARDVALAAYRGHLASSDLDSSQVLLSLLHLHYLRTCGIDPEGERACHRLTRAIALAHTQRSRT
ncbi:lantibiotic dehydratase [Streptomyces sp. NPDC090442]|uniref:lantibiotic dehydratase n=1 Tax=Streptomyces sp. NPDC090442 TaxID=3365962 RepID=UPI0038294CBA